MVVSVIVGLWYTSISNWWDFLMKSRSRKLIWLLDYNVGVSCRLMCMELACCTIVSGSVQVVS